MSDIVVKKDDIRVVDAFESAPLVVGADQILVRIDRFGFSSNNISYALLGDAMNYWSFYPIDEDAKGSYYNLGLSSRQMELGNLKQGELPPHPAEYGRIPVWGFGTVVVSRSDDNVPEGTRIYGYFPMSSYVVLQPEKCARKRSRSSLIVVPDETQHLLQPSSAASDDASPKSKKQKQKAAKKKSNLVSTRKPSTGGDIFVDVCPARDRMPLVYRTFRFCDPRWPLYSPQREERLMIFHPLFAVSFFLDDYLSINRCFDADCFVITSASCKTALAFVSVLRDTFNDAKKEFYPQNMRKKPFLVGLTSGANMKFCEALGLYDNIILYDDYRFYAKLPKPSYRCVYLDFAGVANITVKVHAHFAENMVQSILIGGSHGEVANTLLNSSGGSASENVASILTSSSVALVQNSALGGTDVVNLNNSSPRSPTQQQQLHQMQINTRSHDLHQQQQPLNLPPNFVLPGARPRYFFVPSWLQERTVLVDVLDQNVSVYEKLEASFSRFLGFAETWLRVMEYFGSDEILTGYGDMLERLKCCPDTGVIMSLWPRVEFVSDLQRGLGVGSASTSAAFGLGRVHVEAGYGGSSSNSMGGFSKVMAIEDYYGNATVASGEQGNNRPSKKEQMQSKTPRKTSQDTGIEKRKPKRGIWAKMFGR